MNYNLTEFIRNHQDTIFEKWLEKMESSDADRIKGIISEQVYLKVSSEFVDLILSNVLKRKETFSEELEEFVEKVVRMGWPLKYLTNGAQLIGRLLIEECAEQKNDGVKVTVEVLKDFEQWLAPIYNEIIDLYSNSWENTVMLQKVALQELSAPLIPVFDRITVMPLVGTIDTERAKKIMENLLQGVVKHRSEVVLIDITGVPVVDTMVAHHIIQAAEAVRLVGATCLLVGIRPEIAQTIVNLGINLNQLITKNSLKKGIEAALAITNRKIVEAESEESL